MKTSLFFEKVEIDFFAFIILIKNRGGKMKVISKDEKEKMMIDSISMILDIINLEFDIAYCQKKIESIRKKMAEINEKINECEVIK